MVIQLESCLIGFASLAFSEKKASMGRGCAVGVLLVLLLPSEAWLAGPHTPGIRPHTSADRGAAPLLSDSWLFTSMRDDEGGAGAAPPLYALLAPLSPPLWVGETREQRLHDPGQYQLLESLGNTSFVVIGTRSSVLGLNCTEARVIELSVSRAVICGVARRTISAKAGERPHLAVRASRLVDVEVVTALNAGPPPTLNDLDFFQVNAVVESLSERRQRFCAVWRDAAELSQRETAAAGCVLHVSTTADAEKKSRRKSRRRNTCPPGTC